MTGMLKGKKEGLAPTFSNVLIPIAVSVAIGLLAGLGAVLFHKLLLWWRFFFGLRPRTSQRPSPRVLPGSGYSSLSQPPWQPV